jgi:lipopolysaccharide transport system ATP-binding protein
MGEVAGEGRTVLFVSHNMGAVSALCDKAVYLVKGQVQGIGTAERIVTMYVSELFQNKVDDLEQMRLAGCGKEIRFSDICLVSDDGSSLGFGQPIKYALTIWSDRDFHNLSIGSSIFNSAGNCVGSLITEETFSVSANQKLTIELALSNFNLAPGSYYAGFSIGQGGLDATSRYDLEAVIGKPAFQILPLTEEKTIVANWNSNWGNIVFTDIKLTIDKN